MTKRPADMLFPEAQRERNVAAHKCVEPPFGCGKEAAQFTDELSRKEYAISGLCQECQDEVFKAPEGEEE